ncbi:MAG: glycoside hydrolase family 3 C-terminal domain-containing protein [Oscillospiraceae bacterium]|nr:glycoside hydrolase family 3 C-terminal domain-containing protein [Oscillospiraceae bacterium]
MEMLDYEREHLTVLRPYLAECMVLLKRDENFPLASAGQLALYGSGARKTVKGGTGSGEVNSRFFTNVERGLEEAGFQITTKSWLDAYDRNLLSAKEAFIKEIKARAKKNHTNAVIEGMGAVMPEPDYEFPLDGAGDAAVYVLARICGEGNDRENVPGDFSLTATETRDILKLAEQYPKFMLVLNVGGPVDLSPVADQVGNILILSQLGVETGAALADVMLGKANPSGKLTTTWADWQDYPTVGTFGDLHDTRYVEGIYVGYRYFDSAGVKPRFPFGFGLSYTSFEQGEVSVSLDGETVTVALPVKNSGSVPGKETLQLYASKPEGLLDQPFQSLAAFVKTPELAPGEEKTVSLQVHVSELSSYDTARGSWVLEAGDYFLRLGTSSAETRPVARIRLEEDVITRKVQNVCGKPDFEDWKPKLEVIDMFPPDVPILTLDPAAIPRFETDYHWEEPIELEVAALSTEQLILMNIGAFNPKGGVASVIGNAAFAVAGAAGETCSLFRELGLSPLVMADGPAGLRLSRDYYESKDGPKALGDILPSSVADFMPKLLTKLMKLTSKKPPKNAEIKHQYATAIPIGTAIAQSWNPDFARLCGDIVGDEMERLNVDLWLAPALNIHRSVRCGRNFEYFSEDPLVSGIFAAAITDGVQAHPGRATTIKHYAANNQEINRYNNNSIVSERAMREIYLKGFEICVRHSQPHTLMTSYNLLNGTHTSEHYGILHDILRCEFGFQGIIMTDWVISMMTNKASVHPSADAGRVAAAGGDLFMPGSARDVESMRKAIADGSLSVLQLQRNVSRVYRKTRDLNNKK